MASIRGITESFRDAAQAIITLVVGLTIALLIFAMLAGSTVKILEQSGLAGTNVGTAVNQTIAGLAGNMPLIATVLAIALIVAALTAIPFVKNMFGEKTEEQ